MTITLFKGVDAVTMSSREIAELTGKRHDNVMQVIRALFTDQILTPESQESSFEHRGNIYPCWELSKRDSLVLAARLSPEFTARIVDRWMELEEQAARPMTQAEITAANANHLVAVERRQREQQVALVRIERRVEDLSQTTVWDHCPQNCQSLTRIKETMLKRHGLSGAVVDYVLRVWPNQPNPAGMVRNGHEEALGSQYLVWSKHHVTAAFHRFVSESTMVSATQATHPYFEGRFRLVQKVQS